MLARTCYGSCQPLRVFLGDARCLYHDIDTSDGDVKSCARVTRDPMEASRPHRKPCKQSPTAPFIASNKLVASLLDPNIYRILVTVILSIR